MVCIAMLLGATQAGAADPQPYVVEFGPTGEGAMDDTLSATSELESLRNSAPVSPFGLIARARADIDRLKTVMESYGYYESVVGIKIEGRALTESGIADALVALPKDRKATVELKFVLGPLYHLRTVTLDGALPESAQGVLRLNTGDPAVAATVLGAGARLLSTLQEQGYAFARVDPPVAYQDQHDPVLDVSFHVAAGACVKIGEIRLEGLQRMHAKKVRSRMLLRTGQQFRPSAIEAARRDLLALGPFAAISVQVGTKVDDLDGVPVTFQFRERLRHAVNVTAGYSSDLGGSGGVTWSDRNVFGNAEQLNLSASLINLGGGSATTGLGYDTSAKFVFPDFGRRDQSLQISLGALKQSLQAYDQKAVTSSVVLTRKLSSIWTASVGVSTANEAIEQDQVVGVKAPIQHYTLLGFPVSVSYDSTNLASPLDDPLHGMRNSLSVIPTHAFGSPSADFVISQIKFAGYFDLSRILAADPGRTVLAVRALAGLAEGASELSLPPDQRFYAGGSGTIRGYRYQAVGPQFQNGNPIGGTAIAAGTVELRQRFGTHFGGAVFLDGGQVSEKLKLVPDVLRLGVGFGVRYYTPIGPIRLDIAVPTRHYSNHDDSFEIYIGLGQAF